MIRVRLEPGLPGVECAVLRPLSGHDEMSVTGGNLTDAAALVDRLLVNDDGTRLRPGTAFRFPVGALDRVLVRLYQSLFGDGVESIIGCDVCSKSFELAFSIDGLAERALRTDCSGIDGPEPVGDAFAYRLGNGIRFRLPTTRDQESASGLPPERVPSELLRLCLVDVGPIPGDADAIETAMARLSPVLRLDLDAVCAECGAQHEVHFDVASFLLQALLRERRFLHREVHTLASRYRWSPDEILSLSREDRRAYVALVLADGRAAREALFS